MWFYGVKRCLCLLEIPPPRGGEVSAHVIYKENIKTEQEKEKNFKKKGRKRQGERKPI
jgi:hypothetical protein